MNHQINDLGLIKPIILALAVSPILCMGEVKTLTDATTLLESMGNPNDSDPMKKVGIKVGAWLNGGVTYNANSPSNHFNGPVTFGDRDSEFQLNQLNIYIQRAVAAEGDSWDFGGRFDFMFGTDSIFTQAYGVPAFDVNTLQPLNRGAWDLNFLGSNSNRFYDIALPQAYVEAYIPIGNGLNVKAGHFYTPIGYETVPAPDNFFYSHAYTMQYGEPFTHTGVMANYTINDNFAVMGGVVTGSATGGWDGNFDKQLGNWSGLMGATWTSADKNTSFNASGTYGKTSEHSNNDWAIYSLVFKHNITDKFHMMLQHDHGYADQVLIGTPVDAEWYGINSHWTYDVLDNLAAGLRLEWFQDQNGFRVCSPGRVSASTYSVGGSASSYATGSNPNFLSGCTSGSYYEVTAGVNWKPLKWLNIRPNVRYDWVDAIAVASGGSANPGPFGNNKDHQFLFSTDFNINF